MGHNGLHRNPELPKRPRIYLLMAGGNGFNNGAGPGGLCKAGRKARVAGGSRSSTYKYTGMDTPSTSMGLTGDGRNQLFHIASTTNDDDDDSDDDPSIPEHPASSDNMLRVITAPVELVRSVPTKHRHHSRPERVGKRGHREQQQRSSGGRQSGPTGRSQWHDQVPRLQPRTAEPHVGKRNRYRAVHFRVDQWDAFRSEIDSRWNSR